MVRHPDPGAVRPQRLLERLPHGDGFGDGGTAGRALGAVTYDQEHQKRHEHGETAGGEEGRDPTDVVEGPGHRCRAGHLPTAADHSGQATDQRVARSGEPQGGQADHVEEDERVAESDEEPSGDGHLDPRCEGEEERPEGHRDRAHDQGVARAEPVGEQPGRHLEQHVDQQLEHRKQGEEGGAHVEPALGLQGRDTQAVTVQHGEEVAAHRDTPDQPGARPAHGLGGRVSVRCRPATGCLGLGHFATSLLLSERPPVSSTRVEARRTGGDQERETNGNVRLCGGSVIGKDRSQVLPSPTSSHKSL